MTHIPFAIVPFAIVGFDLDGTLAETLDDLAAALNHALARDGRPALATDTVRSMIGAGVTRLLEQAVAATGGGDESDVARLQAVMLDHYAAHIADHSRLYDGVTAALDALASAGVTLAVVTNKPLAHAEALLDALGIAHRFACIIGGDTPGLARRKPHPDPIAMMIERCGGGPAAFVGDSSFDIRAAKAADVAAIAVSFGYPDVPLAQLGADAVIDRYADLIPTLSRLSSANAAPA